jgi:hypothetical protein
VGGIGARANDRHRQLPDPVVDDGAGDLAAIAAANLGVGDAVQQFQLRRIAKEPERAEADQRVVVARPRQPQPEPGRGKEALAPGDDRSRLLARQDFVVEDESPDARLGEDRVQGIEVFGRDRAEGQAGGAQRGYGFRTRSSTTS